ncbi:amino acid transporter heavy chain SLC3A2-like [Styela clava]
MGSPEKPIDVEMGDMDETNKLNPEVNVKDDGKQAPEAERFTGLKKEELLEISSQKKWVVARWILFIVFWAGWVGMLVGAIIIVVTAPRCKEEPTPPWHQDTVVYEADVKKFAGDLAGMKDHTDYIRSLNSRALTLHSANDPNDPIKVVGGNDADFQALVANYNDEEKDKDIKVVVDLRIDSLSTSSPQFVNSATKACTGSRVGSCAMFKWASNGSVPAADTNSKWLYHSERGESYKVTTADESLAYVDYASQAAVDYIKDLVNAWLGRGADGFQIGDVSRITNTMDVVTAFQSAITSSKNKTEDKTIGLFIVSSDVVGQEALFPTDVNKTDSAAVVINTALSDVSPSDAGAAQKIRDAILKWRNATEPFIGAYAVNTMNRSPLASRMTTEQAAGLSLMSFALPGVPVLRSGDVELLKDDVFNWNTTTKIHIPNNASKVNLDILGKMANMRVSQHQSKQSLRWDDENAVFKFRETNSTEVVAFSRKWDTKPTIVVVYNPTGKEIYIKIKDAGEGEKSKVLLASDPTIEEKTEYALDNIKLNPGLALVLEVFK